MQDKNKNKIDNTIKSNPFFKDEIARLNKYIGILSSTTHTPGVESNFNLNTEEKLKKALQLREVLVHSNSLNKENKELLEARIQGMLSNIDLSDQLKTILQSMTAKIHPRSNTNSP